MKECGKAVRRWMNDSNFVRKYFVGNGVDIGAGPDPLGLYAEFFPMMRGCDHWDLPQGDAQKMAGVADQKYVTIRKAKSWSPKSVNLLDLIAGLDLPRTEPARG
jgi:hypothetical protein